MKGLSIAVKPLGNLFLLMLIMAFAAGTALAQVPVDEDGKPIPAYSDDDDLGFDEDADERLGTSPMSATELEELVGPIALYPDDLLAIVLPASTYPLEIVQAARFLERLESDSTLKPDEDWDDSVVALLNYPDVIRMMDEDIDWTWRLGEAVISQQNEVIAAVESFRDRAYAAGNLKSDEYQKVTNNDDGVIEIVPVSEEIIYVPYYEPEEVLVYQPRRVYYYYPDPYPVYYYPYPLGYRFHSGFFWGVTTAFHIGWSNHYLHVYHPSYWGHPYYGRYYASHYYYRRPSITVYNNWYVNNRYNNSRYRYRDGDHWRPRRRAGSRPDEPRVRNHHYPPDRREGDRNRRDNQREADRNRLQSRENGRMNLNLRERDGNNDRVATDNNRQTRVANGNRSSAAGRTAARDRDNDRADRAASTRRDQARVNDNRARIGANNARTSENRNRDTESRPAIRFRDRRDETRSNNPAAADTRTTTRPSTRRQNRPATSSNNAGRNVTTSRQNQQRAAIVTDRSSGSRLAGQPQNSRRTTQRVAPPPRASAPAVRQSNPAPRASAPAAERRAPAATQDNARSSSRGSSDAGQRRRSSSSRARRDNH